MLLPESQRESGICWEENGVDGALGWIVALKYTPKIQIKFRHIFQPF